jgi:hypothetical protein
MQREIIGIVGISVEPSGSAPTRFEPAEHGAWPATAFRQRRPAAAVIAPGTGGYAVTTSRDRAGGERGAEIIVQR